MTTSIQITGHNNSDCDACMGAAFHHDDHYALGRFRLAVAQETELARDAARQMSIESLARRLHEKRAADTERATIALIRLEARLG